MASRNAQGGPSAPRSHLVLYDGVCGLCNRLLAFLLAHDRRGVFVFASLQSGIGRAMVARFGGNPDELSSFYVVADFESSAARALTKSDAALFVARQLGWPWKAASAARALPRPVRQALYDSVAAHRYRLFGRHDVCPMPDAASRGRFVG